MKSILAQRLRELSEVTEAMSDDELIRRLEVIQELVSEFQDATPYPIRDIAMISDPLVRVAASNIIINAPENPMVAMQIAMLVNEPLVQTLVAYSCKFAIYLHLAEMRAQASGELTWIVAPEPPQESQPNQDPPVEPLDVPPSAS